MQMNLADWLLDVNVALTMSLSLPQAEDHCTCGYCRNFYSAADLELPKLRSFLSEFGIDMEGPDEFCPFEPTIYEATYIVQGNILRRGTEKLHIDGVPLSVLSADEVDFETSHPSPRFALKIGLFELPWVLDESAEDVISPANCPECIQRMEQKLLRYSLENDLTS